MLWLIGQIIVFLIIAVVIGFLIGWLLRTLWPSSRNRAREGELEAALERASARITDLETGLRAKRAAANTAAEQEEAARRKVEALEAELANLHSHGDVDNGEVERLQAELEEATGAIGGLRSEVAELRADADELAELRAERDAAVRALQEREAELAALTDPGAVTTEQPGLFPIDAGRFDQEPGGLFEHEAGESAEPAEPEPPGEPEQPAEPEVDPEELERERLAAVALVTERFAAADPTEPDDLKRIRGIGPVLERVLNEMNVTTFAQIADFDEGDVALVSAALGKAFPDRITRDDWMGSARALLEEDRTGG